MQEAGGTGEEATETPEGGRTRLAGLKEEKEATNVFYGGWRRLVDCKRKRKLKTFDEGRTRLAGP